MNENTQSPDTQERIVCKPTKWFLWRALGTLAMFSVFTFLFIKDGKTGYRDKNYQYYMYESFKDAGESFESMKAAGGLSEAKWKEFASQQKLSVPEDRLDTLPRDPELSMALPSVVVGGYAVLDAQQGKQGVVELWLEYSSLKEWGEDPGSKAYDAGNIRNQFIAAGVAGILAAIVLFILIRTSLRSIEADGEALYTQCGAKVPYADMTRVDKRKWENKGMAVVHYQEDGVEKKAKIDGMVYGQFDEADGAPAEKLFALVLANFKGEILEYEELEDPEEGSEESA